jgi:hypothetical protein
MDDDRVSIDERGAHYLVDRYLRDERFGISLRADEPFDDGFYK